MAEAHLNGSVNLASAEAVFHTVSEIAGDSIRRLPDGETGERLGWIEALVPKLRSSPELEERPPTRVYKPFPIFGLREGASGEQLDIPELGYAAAAKASYATFRRLREEEAIAPGVRFQVSLPTVTAGVEPFMAPEDREAVEPAYGRRLRQEVDQILADVPHDELALQWDVAVEMGLMEGVVPTRFDDPFEEVVERLCGLADWVPADVPIGYHLCYGDAQEVTGEGEGRHWKEPEDLSKLAAVANAVAGGAARPLHWFSMPVPIDRDDDAYFEPLADLRLEPPARLYLGLVHHQDGVDGTQRRIETAKRHWPDFGVATECGMGRKPAELVPKLLRIQRDVEV